jgi:hypothetical protein
MSRTRLPIHKNAFHRSSGTARSLRNQALFKFILSRFE